MEKKIIKTGIIGAGFAARFHYAALQHVISAKVDIVGAYSRNFQSCTTFCNERNLTPFEDISRLIDACDVIHVCTPPITHETIVIEVLSKNKDVIVEKPFTGYYGNGSESFSGDSFSREEGLAHTLDSIKRMLDAERRSTGKIMYAENWVYSPAIQKERELLEKTKAQILWMHGEQSHSGSHSLSYGQWKLSGGGSMVGKGCHPLSVALYFKQVEGRVRFGKPIRPKSITARTHAITRMPGYENAGYLQTTYKDIEDFALMHIVFDDDTIASLFASELVLGGVNNWIEINANNHRTKCQMSQNDSMKTYTPSGEHFKDVYVVEKIETKQGWSFMSPDEGWFHGYQHEMNAFYRSVILNEPIESNSNLAADTIATIYAGYVSAERKGTEVAITIL